MRSADVLILGGGLAGLSCRAALAQSRDVLLCEQEPELGGLARVYRHGPYTFDTVVHVLFFRSERVRQGLLSLLPLGARRFKKRNLVWQRSSTIEYPYQFNTHGLPEAVRSECIGAFIDNPYRAVLGDGSFRDWLLTQFGAGFFRHFFEPYNRKLYGVDLASLEAEPMIWTIPANSRAAVLDGARSAPPECVVPWSYYPSGPSGIQALAESLRDAGGGDIWCSHRALCIEYSKRRVRFDTGKTVAYRQLVTSLPLPCLLGCLQPAPAVVSEVLGLLDATPITVLRVGARRSGTGLGAHWTYFPDPEIPFYRMTRLERIAPDLCPSGGAALLLECSGSSIPDVDRALDTLAMLNVVDRRDVEHADALHVPFAYVRFRRGYGTALARVREFLDAWGIQSIGRFGEWRYANIEQTVESGLNAARRLLGRAGTPFLERFAEP